MGLLIANTVLAIIVAMLTFTSILSICGPRGRCCDMYGACSKKKKPAHKKGSDAIEMVSKSNKYIVPDDRAGSFPPPQNPSNRPVVIAANPYVNQHPGAAANPYVNQHPGAAGSPHAANPYANNQPGAAANPHAANPYANQHLSPAASPHGYQPGSPHASPHGYQPGSPH